MVESTETDLDKLKGSDLEREKKQLGDLILGFIPDWETRLPKGDVDELISPVPDEKIGKLVDALFEDTPFRRVKAQPARRITETIEDGDTQYNFFAIGLKDGRELYRVGITKKKGPKIEASAIVHLGDIPVFSYTGRDRNNGKYIHGINTRYIAGQARGLIQDAAVAKTPRAKSA